MNATEAAALCRYVKACCPQQKFDEYTPDAWHDLLDDIAFGDAKEAARMVAKSQPFVSPAEIRTQVAMTNRARSRELPPVVPPRDLADHPRQEIEWSRLWGDAFIAGHTEERAREIANRQMGVSEDEPLAIGTGPAAAIKADLEAAAFELVRKQSLREADQRDYRERKLARHAAARAAELERVKEPRDQATVLAAHTTTEESTR